MRQVMDIPGHSQNAKEGFFSPIMEVRDGLVEKDKQELEDNRRMGEGMVLGEGAEEKSEVISRSIYVTTSDIISFFPMAE